MDKLIVYKINIPQAKSVKLDETNFIFDSDPAPKLLKFGFNSDTSMADIASVLSNPYYRTGLYFDFDRDDAASMQTALKKHFVLKKSDPRLATICWEIYSSFLIPDKKKVTIATNEVASLELVTESAEKLFKLKAKTDVVSLKDKAIPGTVFWFASQIPIEENAYVHILMTELPKLFAKQSTGSNLVVQIFGIQTQIMADIIYFLSTCYKEAYVMKPSVISDLSDEKYVVLLNQTNSLKLKLSIPTGLFLTQLGIGPVPDIFVNTIQCLNAELLARKVRSYQSIKRYIDSKIYEGITHDQMIQTQNLHTTQWIKTFTNQKDLEKNLDQALIQSSTECDHAAEFNNLYAMI